LAVVAGMKKLNEHAEPTIVEYKKINPQKLTQNNRYPVSM